MKVTILSRSGLVRGVLPDQPDAEAEVMRIVVEGADATTTWARELEVLRPKGRFPKTVIRAAVEKLLAEMGQPLEEVEVDVSVP